MLPDELPQDFLEFNARFGTDEQCRESLRVAFPAACGVACSRQRARRLAHHHTRMAHRSFSEYPAPWGGDPLLDLVTTLLRFFYFSSKKIFQEGIRHTYTALSIPQYYESLFFC